MFSPSLRLYKLRAKEKEPGAKKDEEIRRKRGGVNRQRHSHLSHSLSLSLSLFSTVKNIAKEKGGESVVYDPVDDVRPGAEKGKRT